MQEVLNLVLVSHDFFALSFSHIDQHVDVGIVGEQIVGQHCYRAWLLGKSVPLELEFTDLSSHPLAKRIVFGYRYYISIVELIPLIGHVWPDESVVMTGVYDSSVYQDGMQVVLVWRSLGVF